MATYGLIADDLTGALDAGAGFARHGMRAALPFSGQPEDVPDADVVLINTETRDEADAAAAREAARTAAQRLKRAGVERVYKKIDSVLRGHPGAELAAVLDVFGGRALVAPAFPAQGRTTIGATQLLHGNAVEPFGGDLRLALGAAAGRCDVHDAASDENLARLAREASAGGYAVWCGTAGLAAHLPAALALRPAHGRPPSLPPVERILVLAGTSHRITNAQLDRLSQEPLPQVHVLFEGRRCSTAPEVAAALHQAARELRLDTATALILTGGETAQIVCRALHAQSIEILGEALPGIPVGLLQLPNARVAAATKSGGFGGPDALLQTTARLLNPALGAH